MVPAVVASRLGARYTAHVRTLTREQSREIDRIAQEELLIPGLLLMENAAIGIAAEALSLAGKARAVAIVCGPGNNGGDGLAAARHLSNRGLDVSVHLPLPGDAYGDRSDAATNLRIVHAMGIRVREDLEFGDAALVVDALLGTGLVRDIRDPFRAAVLAMNDLRCPVLSVDLPSGLDANSGEVLGVAVRATVTATMVAPKVGFARGDGPIHVGRVVVVDIGIPPSLVERVARATPPADRAAASRPNG
jgi:NAD(P)H-hydrate epimerase